MSLIVEQYTFSLSTAVVVDAIYAFKIVKSLAFASAMAAVSLYFYLTTSSSQAEAAIYSFWLESGQAPLMDSE